MDDNGSAHSSMFGDLSTEEVTSKIILTAIIVLFMAVLFVLILHLYAKLYWWRIDQLQQQQQLQQQEQEQEEDQSSTAPPVITRRQRRRFIFVPGQDALSNTGLTPFELSSLPIVFFRQDSCKDGLECAICLSELVKGDKARLLPKCNHSFHVECIDMWFQSHSTCPICRNKVLGSEQASSKRVEQVLDNADHAGSTNNNHDALSQISASSPEFPTNVLVWGRQNQVSTGNTNVGPQEDGAGNAASQSQEAVVLDINDSSTRSQNVSSSSSSMRYIVEEEEPKSPMTTRLRSLRRFLSRDKRVACSNSSTSSSSSNAVTSVDP